MLQVNFIRENKELLLAALAKRGFKEAALIDEVIRLDDLRRSTQKVLDEVLAEANKAAKEIGQLYRQGKREEAEVIKQSIASSKSRQKELTEQLNTVKAELNESLLHIPNCPHPSVPAGMTEDDNEVFKAWGEDLPVLDKSAQPHWELVEKYDIIDFKLGTKIAGSGFPLYKGKGAKLQRALINFFLDEATDAGYLEILPPHLVNEESARATGQLPDKEGQMYHATKDNLYLIPTAEVPVTNMYRNVIVNEKDFPIKLTGYTPCFRREAGAHGKDTRGLNRVHQFDKVEIVQIVKPEGSYDVLHAMIKHIEGLLQKLELPYRILRLCGGDLGFTSALTFDFEVYSAAQKRWLEVSSVSNFETFQSNRLKVRYKGEGKKMHLAHTLNGSALALARIVAALLENNQTAEGIVIPEALRPYTRFDIIN